MHTALRQVPLIKPVTGAVSMENKLFANAKITEKVSMADVTPANFNTNEDDETGELLCARLVI